MYIPVKPSQNLFHLFQGVYQIQGHIPFASYPHLYQEVIFVDMCPVLLKCTINAEFMKENYLLQYYLVLWHNLVAFCTHIWALPMISTSLQKINNTFIVMHSSWNLYQKSTKNYNDFDFCFWATPFYISEFNSINCSDLKVVSFNSFNTFTLKIAQINQKHLQSKIIPNKSIKNCAQTQKFTYNFREKFVVVLPQHHSNIFLQSLIFSHATF